MDLVITHPFLIYRDGVSRVILEIAKKYDPVIYVVRYSKETTFSGFKEFDIRILPKSKLEKPFLFLRNDARRYYAAISGIRYLLAKIPDSYDVINAHGTPAEWIRNKNERVVWYCYSPNREAFDLYSYRMSMLPFHKKILNWFLIQCYKIPEYAIVPKIERIIAVSEVSKERISKYLGRDDAIVVNPGVDIERFHNESYEKYFFYPSRIVPEKRFEFAIEAFKIFHKNFSDFKLIIAGSLQEEEKSRVYIQKLRELAKGYPIEFRINIAEEELLKLYSNSYAVLFSAINEDFGLVPLEAMACEKPIIAVNEGGPRYTIINGKTGFLVNSPKEMAEKMITLAEDPSMVEKIGKEGRKLVKEKYTWKNFLSSLGKIFKEVAKV